MIEKFDASEVFKKYENMEIYLYSFYLDQMDVTKPRKVIPSEYEYKIKESDSENFLYKTFLNPETKKPAYKSIMGLTCVVSDDYDELYDHYKISKTKYLNEEINLHLEQIKKLQDQIDEL